MKFDIILEKPLKKTIIFDKIGIKIRSLNINEKKKILEKMNNMYFTDKAKRRIKKYLAFKQNLELDETIQLEESNLRKKYSEVENQANFIYEQYLNYKHISKLEVKQNLERFAIVESDDKIEEFINPNLKRFFVNSIIRFLIYIKSEKLISAEKIKHMIISDERISIFNNDEPMANTIKILNRHENIPLTEIKLTYEDFLSFKKFIENITKERIRDFIIIVENLFNENNILENRIVSLTSIIERLLIKHDNNYDIGKQFVLKYGLILNEKDNDFRHQYYLNYCYAVRSCIVHGDDKNILDLPKKYLKYTTAELDEIIESSKHYNKRDRSLHICRVYLETTIKFPLKEWVENTRKIEFLKNN